MPVMDGYEATGTIRNPDSNVRNHNIPIIAITANAMKGDREKCLAVGMNDYITKPINKNELADAIVRSLSNEGKEQDDLGFQNSDCGLKGKDPKPETLISQLNKKVQEEPETKTQSVPEAICSAYADDTDLVELIDEFVAGLEDEVQAMRKVLMDGDYDGLCRLAHQMKGAGGSYGYQMLTDAAKVLEAAAKAEDTKAGTTALNELEALCQAADRGRKVHI